MAVHRITPAESPYQRDLGRVLVTIDDLEALAQVLRLRDPAATVSFGFENGTFDDPMDLALLTPAEMKSIRVTTSNVKVLLQRESAVALGDRQVVDDVCAQWSAQRQHVRQIREMAAVSGQLWSQVGAAGSVLGVVFFLLAGSGQWILGLALLAGLLVFFVVNAAARKLIALISPLGTTVVAKTRAQYEASRESQLWPRIATIVSIIAALIAIAAIAVPVFVNN